MSRVDASLRDVMKQDVDFHWDKSQQRSFEELKELCCSVPVLAYYDVTKDVTIQCDVSSYGLRGVLLQESRPVAYTGALTPTRRERSLPHVGALTPTRRERSLPHVESTHSHTSRALTPTRRERSLPHVESAHSHTSRALTPTEKLYA